MLITEEQFHIYNRGAHKALIFHDSSDYARFMALLHAANFNQPLKEGWYESGGCTYRFQPPGGAVSRLVRIISYCLMPNHYHIHIEQIIDGGAEKFIHKLCTSYGMYYNKKYLHSGTIFQGNYKWKHVDTDEYSRYLIEYIHLNPFFGIEEPDIMSIVKSEFHDQAVEYSKKYLYSSFRDYLGEIRPQNAIIDR